MTISLLLLGTVVCTCAVAQIGSRQMPLACNSKAISATERPRYKELLGNLKLAVRERRELPDGYSFRLDERTVSLKDMAEWAGMERRCCPFLNFNLEFAGGETNLWLTLKGPTGVKLFLDAELAIEPN